MLETDHGISLAKGQHACVGVTKAAKIWPPETWPSCIEIFGNQEEHDRFASCYEETIEALVPFLGNVRASCFLIQGRGEDLREMLDTCIDVSLVWDMSFFGKYAKKFDPFGTPTDLNNEFLYPVVNASHEDERGRNEMIDLQVSVRHRPSAPSDLILHSEHGFELMQEISATAGLEIERLPGRFPSGN